MKRLLIAAAAGVALVATTAGVAGAATGSSTDRQQDLIQKVNSTGWGARVSQDRYPYAYGFEDEGYEPAGAPTDDYGYEEQPVYRHGRHPAVRAAPYGYEPDDE